MSDALGRQISVCVLTYNHVNVVESTIRTLLEQSISGYELLVSDDQSSDGTWDVIRRMADADDRVHPVQTPARLGMAGNANFAMSRSRRPLVALLHHDDLYRSDLLEKWGRVLERHPQANFAFNPYLIFETGRVHEEPMPGDLVDGRWLLDTYLLPRWGCIVRGTAMVRREAWDRVGGMRPQFGLLADVDLWMRLAKAGPVGYVPEPLISVRQERPSYYPDIYTGRTWSWERQKLLYEIHAVNRLGYLDLGSLAGRLKWWGFRARLSAETAKWLTYAALRGRDDMLAKSSEGATTYDLWVLRAARWALTRRSRVRLSVERGEGRPK